MDLFGSLIEALEADQPVIVATIVGPMAVPAGLLGRRLLERADGATSGGLGLAALDGRAVEAGHGLMNSIPPAKLFRWSLAPDEQSALGLAPGAEIEVFVEAILPPPALLIVGAGHIAQPLAQLGKVAGFRVTVLDDRAEFASRERFPGADRIVAGAYGVELARLPVTPNTYVVLVTRGHVQDEEALRQVITAGAGYLGMIGSSRRVSGVLHRMAEMGVPQEAIDRVYSPIGLDIGAETPEEIAVSIMAEIVNVRRRGASHPSSLLHVRSMREPGQAEQ
ncbi:MAG: XdhC family protein [Anaerolineae bacterium]